jgi:hypothetical protein
MDEQEQFHCATILAQRAVTRLRCEGHSNAFELVGAVVSAEDVLMLKYRVPFAEARFKKRLDQLPDTNWSDSIPQTLI